MNMSITVITPTTGKPTLDRLITSLKRQHTDVEIEHILLWDNNRDDASSPAKSYFENTESYKAYSIELPGPFVFGGASGSALRSVGMMAARGHFVTFADDDVWFDESHFYQLSNGITSKSAPWGYCRRKIWHKGELFGVDNFESVGDSVTKKVPYEMVDNNSMVFARRLASSAACLYRETTDYNDDRLMYEFLKGYGGLPFITEAATVNQDCPDKLVEFFRANCTKES